MEFDLLTFGCTTAGSGAASWAVFKVELRFLWRDVNELKKKVENLEAIKWHLEKKQTAR